MSEGAPTERFGPYLVYEQLGVGGMAQVHRAVAIDSGVPRPVALKRMLSHIAGSESMVKSFVREARLASYLRHENVAQTYDLGMVGETYFIVMELVLGRNLREVLRHAGATTGPMPVPVALNLLNQICDALDYAHNLRDETGQPLGIIHRDVSPSNVIVSTSGVVKLIDFGIAKASAAGMQTMSGTLKGKFAYMAPEYIAGRIDARADLFAVGVIAHELLTNRPLFAGRDDIDTLTRVRDMHIDPPSRRNPRVPAEIDDVVMTALARDPDRRWQHATALRNALTTLTHRLDLVASNAQVIEWLDRAFAHARPEPDTDPDAAPIDDEPSISMSFSPAAEPPTRERGRPSSPPGFASEPVTVDRAGRSAQITLRLQDRPPAPPTQTPLGTPVYVPAQHPLPAGLAGADPSEADAEAEAEAEAAAAAHAPASLATPGLARSSSAYPSGYAMGHATAYAAAIPAGLTGAAAPPPIAAPAGPLRGLATAPPGYPAVTPLGSAAHAAQRAPHRPPLPAAPPLAGGIAGLGGLAGFGGLAGTAGSAGSWGGPPAVEVERSAEVQRAFAQRMSAPMTAARAVQAGGRQTAIFVTCAILLAIASGIAAYFVLPLLT